MNSDYNRPDGRKPTEIRELEIKVGVLDRADGSAKVILGKNLVMATVYGPRELHPKHFALANKAVVRVNYRMATFSVDDYKRPFPSRREKEISKVLSEAFGSIVLTKSFPRSVIDVHVQILQSDGGTRTVAAIAISAALADAGVPMRALTGGIASGIYDNVVVLDMTGHEDMVGTGDMPILYSPAVDEISLFQLDGMFTFDQFKQALTYSLDEIKSVVTTIQNALKEKYLAIRDEIGIPDEEVENEIEKEEKLAEKLVKEIDEEEQITKDELETEKIITDPFVAEEPSSAELTNDGYSPVVSSVKVNETEAASKFALVDDSLSLTTEDTPSESEISSVNEQTEELQPISEEESDSIKTEPASSWYNRTRDLEQQSSEKSQDENSHPSKDENELVDKKQNNDSDKQNDVLRDLEYSDIEEDE